jgi:hypothetical protein
MLGRSMNGTGTRVYGKRDFRTDGSFVTTKWITFLWVPLVPLRSMRVKPLEESEVDHLGASILLACVGLLHFKFSGKYVIQSVMPPALMQVLHVYAFVLAIVVAWWNLARNTNFLSAALLCGVLTSPFLLRSIARNNATEPPSHAFVESER